MLSSPFVSATDLSAAIIQTPLTVSPDTTVMAAMTLMSGIQPSNPSKTGGECEDSLEDPLSEIRLSCVLVVEGDRFLGLLTERDMVRLSAQGKALDSIKVAQVMVPAVLTLQESECRDVFLTVSRLRQHNVRHVPILNDLNCVVGLLMPEQLQRNGTFYEALAAACPVGIFRTDNAGCCIYVNERWCQIAGLQCAEAMGFGWVDGLHPEDRDRVISEWTASVESNRPFQLEYRFQNGEGKTTWVYGQAVAERGLTGEILGYVGTITDISDRQRAKHALEFQIELDRLVAGISSRFIQLSSQNTTDGINQALREIGEFTQVDSSYIFQYSDLEPIHSMTHEWVAPGVTPQLQNCQNLPLDVYPWATNLLKNGEIVYVSNSEVLPPEAVIDQQNFQHFGIKSSLVIPLIAQNQVKGLVGFVSFQETCLWSEDNIRLLKIFADILMNTLKRQEVEAELKASEERLRLTLMAAKQGLYDLNLKTHEAIVNTEYAEMLGYDPLIFRETNAQWIERLHPEDQARVAHVYQAYVAGNIPDYQVEFRQRTKNGDWKWILSIGKIVAWDEEGQPLRMLGTHTDISDRKQVELSLQEANQKITTIWESMTDAYATLDREWRVIYANSAATQIISSLTNLEPEEFLGKTHWELFPFFAGKKLEQEYRRAMNEQVAVHLELLFEPTGNWFEIHVYPSKAGLGLYFRDISDRKQAEAEQQQSARIQGELKLLEQILDIVLAGYWDWDIPSNQEYLSPGLKQMFGYQDEELPNRPETWQRLILAEDLPGVFDCFERHVQSHGEVPYYNEVRCQHKDGSTVWVICSGQVIEWDTAGNPIRMIGCHIDITARKLAEADLIESRDLREAIFNELADALFLVDVETLLTLDCNQRAVELFGVEDRAELIGIEGHTLQRHQFADEVLADIAHQIQVQGFWSQELEYVTRQGNFFWGNIAAKPIVVAGNTMNLVRVSDISNRKQAEEELRNLSDRLTLAVKSGEIAIWDWNIVENSLTWDDRMYELYDTTPDEFTNIYDAWASRVHPEDRPIAETAIQKALEGESDYNLEFRVLHSDGTIHFIRAFALVKRNAQGESCHMVGINFEITDQKRVEIALRQTAIQLAATNRELESFSYSVSHDLRAPLRHMSGFVNALRQQLSKHQILEDPKVAHYLEVIEHSSDKMAQLIDGLLSLSRIGRRPMAWQPVPLRDLVETAISFNQPEVGDSCAPRVQPPVEFVIGELPTLVGDTTLLQQVFQNLIDNAIKFSRNAATPRVEIGSEPDGTVWVKDNGAGFQMEYADKLFSAFQRLHSQAEFEGTGIGLAIVQRIVQRHGGTVWAEGIPQQGATFYLKLGGQNSSLH